MHKIDSSGNVNGEFTGGNPQEGQQATVVDAPWLNAVQGEIVATVEDGGGPLAKGTNTQMRDALRAKYGAKATGNTWQKTQIFGNGAGAILLTPGTEDHVYAAFYARTADPDTRSGFLGFANTGTTVFDIRNELAGGNIALTPGAGGNIVLTPGAGGKVSIAGPSSVSGDVDFSTAPQHASTVALSNVLTRISLPRAWGVIVVNAGTVTVQDGMNIAGATLTGGGTSNITVEIAADMFAGTYAVIGNRIGNDGETANGSVSFHSRTAGTFKVRAFDTSNFVINPVTGSFTFAFVVFGRQ